MHTIKEYVSTAVIATAMGVGVVVIIGLSVATTRVAVEFVVGLFV